MTFLSNPTSFQIPLFVVLIDVNGIKGFQKSSLGMKWPNAGFAELWWPHPAQHLPVRQPGSRGEQDLLHSPPNPHPKNSLPSILAQEIACVVGSHSRFGFHHATERVVHHGWGCRGSGTYARGAQGYKKPSAEGFPNNCLVEPEGSWGQERKGHGSEFRCPWSDCKLVVPALFYCYCTTHRLCKIWGPCSSNYWGFITCVGI